MQIFTGFSYTVAAQKLQPAEIKKKFEIKASNLFTYY